MGKEKITEETLVHKCSNEQCTYNAKNFCNLPSIMLDEEGTCIYKAKNRNGECDCED